MRNYTWKILKSSVFILYFTIISCNKEKIASSSTLLRENDSGCKKEENIIIKTQTEWESFWERATAHFQSPPPIPVVDFSQNIVAAAIVTYSCKSISVEIKKIKETKDKVILYVSKPNADVVMMVESYPIHIITIPYTNKPIEFVEKK